MKDACVVTCRGYWRCQHDLERVLRSDACNEPKKVYDAEIVHSHMVRPAWVEKKRGETGEKEDEKTR